MDDKGKMFEGIVKVLGTMVIVFVIGLMFLFLIGIACNVIGEFGK